ncbi:MAG: ribbon-helix-helix protein, CopG family [Candidatus Lokiarchaeota archaeon]|nr:ribbon-helix-helix protein, CopG family [Candidatus Lokiarchaeota archaeon]
MQIITINLPEKYLDAIQILNDLKIYPSRSEAIRVALNNFLSDELKMDKELEVDNFKMLARSRINQPK